MINKLSINNYPPTHTFSGRSSEFTWLYRIMLSAYSKHHRRERLRRHRSLTQTNVGLDQLKIARGSTERSPKAELAEAEDNGLLRGAVDRLPARLRTVVALHYFDGMALKEIAEVLKCRVGTVKSRLSSARKRLRTMLRRRL